MYNRHEPKLYSRNHPDGIELDNVDTLSEQSQLVKQSSVQAYPRKTKSRHSLMHSSPSQIVLAGSLMLLPAILCGALIYLIYSRLESPDLNIEGGDSITDNGRNQSLSVHEYYVDYSATRLVFVSSLASTLALALMPVAMSLFAYMTALAMQKASSTAEVSQLPSPYQFELCLRLLRGNIVDFGHYFRYLIRSKRRRIPVPPVLHYAAGTLGVLLSIAIATTIVDALLHTKTSSVQYNRTNLYPAQGFNPGRRLPEDCLNFTSEYSFGLYGYDRCNVNSGGSGVKPSFSNASEAYRVMGNASDRSFIRLADDGQTAVITTPESPPGVSYIARSYASSTTCKTITSLCNIYYNGVGDCDACMSWAYNCTVPTAGVNMTGNLTDGEIFLNSNIVINFYNESSKTTSVTGFNPKGVFNGQMWTSFLFKLPNAEYSDINTTNMNGLDYTASTDLVWHAGIAYGILSCNTSLSDVKYFSDTSGNIKNASLTPMNDTASTPFFAAFGFPALPTFGDLNLNQGLNLAGVSTTNKEGFAYQFARVIDRTILGLSAGILPEMAADSIHVTGFHQVAKVPRAEFIALNVLGLLLSALGVVLAIQAFVLSRKQGIVDLQARLGLGAMVAGVFEDETLNQTATSVGELYAELRGLPPGRILALDPRTSEGNVLVKIDKIGGINDEALR